MIKLLGYVIAVFFLVSHTYGGGGGGGGGSALLDRKLSVKEKRLLKEEESRKKAELENKKVEEEKKKVEQKKTKKLNLAKIEKLKEDIKIQINAIEEIERRIIKEQEEVKTLKVALEKVL